MKDGTGLKATGFTDANASNAEASTRKGMSERASEQANSVSCNCQTDNGSAHALCSRCTHTCSSLRPPGEGAWLGCTTLPALKQAVVA